MKITTRTAGAALAALAIAIATGCSSGGSGASDGPIRLAVQAGAGNEAAYGWAIEEFMADNPGVVIEPDFIGGDFGAVIATQMRGANAPVLVDLVPGGSVPHSVFAMSGAGFLDDLSDQPWASEIAAGTRPLVTDGDAVYGWPTVVQVSGLFANADLLGEHGIAVPATVDDLLQACAQLSAAGITPIAWTGNPVSRNGAQLTTLTSVTSAVSPETVEAVNTRTTSFSDSPGWQDAFGLLERLRDGRCFAEDAAVASGDAVDTAILTGRAAMIISNSQQYGAVMAQAGPDTARLEVYPFPGATAADAASLVTPYNAITVNTRAAEGQKAAAKRFIEFLSDPEIQPEFARLIGNVAPVDLAAGEFPEGLTNLASTVESDRAFVNPALLWGQGMYPALAAGVQGVLSMQTSAADALRSLDQAATGP